MTITYTITTDSGVKYELNYDKTTPLGYKTIIGEDWHELYFVMPGEILEPWMCPLVASDSDDAQTLSFLKHTPFDNFWWVPIGKRAEKEPKGRFATDEAMLRFI